VPYEENKSKTFKNIKQKLQTEQKLCECFEFKIPKLKTGTLDQLMTLSDDLIKYDNTVESITMKMLRTLSDVGEIDEQEFVPEVILLDESAVPTSMYLNYFQWDENQYLLNKSLTEITDNIYKKAMKIDDELKVKLAEYTTLKTNIQQIERKTSGNLSIKSLDGIVRAEHIVESEYLQTLFVAVPRGQFKEWEMGYDDLEELESGVVPGSSDLIIEDNEYGLFSVVVLRKIAGDFKNACSKRKWVVRQFDFDEEKYKLSQLEKGEMEHKRDSLKRELFDWCKMGFSECFSSWIHLKAVRTFVETVLRYGLPPRFCSVLLKVNKNDKKIHKYFKDNYGHLQEESFDKVDESELGGLGAQFGNMEFHPYVLITINTHGSPLLKL